MRQLDPNTVIGIHIGITLFLAFLAWKIFFLSPIPKYFAYLIVLIIISVIAVHIWAWKKKDTKSKIDEPEKKAHSTGISGATGGQRGDSIYDIIGGIAGFG